MQMAFETNLKPRLHSLLTFQLNFKLLLRAKLQHWIAVNRLTLQLCRVILSSEMNSVVLRLDEYEIAVVGDLLETPNLILKVDENYLLQIGRGHCCRNTRNENAWRFLILLARTLLALRHNRNVSPAVHCWTLTTLVNVDVQRHLEWEIIKYSSRSKTHTLTLQPPRRRRRSPLLLSGRSVLA